MMRRVLAVLGIALGVSVPVSFVAHPAFASASDTAVAQALVTSTLNNLGLSSLSPELTAKLTRDLEEAVTEGVIDPDIKAAVAGVLENPEMLTGLTDVFSKHLSQQTQQVGSWSPPATVRPSNAPLVPGQSSGQGGKLENDDSTEAPKVSSSTGTSNSGGQGNGKPGGNGDGGTNSENKPSDSSDKGGGRPNPGEQGNGKPGGNGDGGTSPGTKPSNPGDKGAGRGTTGGNGSSGRDD